MLEFFNSAVANPVLLVLIFNLHSAYGNLNSYTPFFAFFHNRKRPDTLSSDGSKCFQLCPRVHILDKQKCGFSNSPSGKCFDSFYECLQDYSHRKTILYMQHQNKLSMQHEISDFHCVVVLFCLIINYEQNLSHVNMFQFMSVPHTGST